MIRATVAGAKVQWDKGTLKVESASSDADSALRMAFVQRGHRAFNPAVGGSYLGFDESDPFQVMDGLLFLRRMGVDVEIEEATFDLKSRRTYPGAFDNRNLADWAWREGAPHEDPFPVLDEEEV